MPDVLREIGPREAQALSSLFHRRWAAPALAFLHREGGATVAAIAHHVPGSRGAVRAAVSALVRDGWAERPTGHAHPLRPEITLTPCGHRLAATLTDLLGEFEHAVGGLPRKKWAFPVLAVFSAEGSTFGELGAALPDITDRALSAALKYLEEVGLVERGIGAGWPRSMLYRPSQRASPVVRDLDAVIDAVFTSENS